MPIDTLPEIIAARQALQCLHLAVEGTVAADVKQKVERAFDALTATAKDQPVGSTELDNAGMVTVLNRYAEFKGGQKAAADMLGITPQYLCDILQGRRDVSETVAGKLGYGREVVYRLHGKRESTQPIGCREAFEKWWQDAARAYNAKAIELSDPFIWLNPVPDITRIEGEKP